MPIVMTYQITITTTCDGCGSQAITMHDRSPRTLMLPDGWGYYRGGPACPKCLDDVQLLDRINRKEVTP